MSDSESKDKFDLARRALRGIGGRDGKQQQPAKGSPEDKAPAPEPKGKGKGQGKGDVLGRMVDALKHGSTGITAVEPEGYGHFEILRTGARTLAKGARGDAVDALQRVLRKVGIEGVPTNGRFDEATEAAVVKFQEKNGLEVKGVVDAATVVAFDKALGLPERRPADEEEEPSAPTSELGVDSGNEFIDRIAPGAVRGMHETGFPASVHIAMAVLESEWGATLLAAHHNNIFGVRGEGPAGSVALDEDGLQPGSVAYKRYDDPAEGLVDHAKTFAKSERYRNVMSHASHPESFARALSGTYSEDPNYGPLLVRIMKQFELARYDRVRPSGGAGGQAKK